MFDRIMEAISECSILNFEKETYGLKYKFKLENNEFTKIHYHHQKRKGVW